MSIVDNSIEKIKILYDLGEGGQYEIIHRTIFVIKNGLEFGYSSKELVDRMMDKGVKPLELGISLAVALSEVNPSKLNGVDSSIRIKIMNTHKPLLDDWSRMVAQND